MNLEHDKELDILLKRHAKREQQGALMEMSVNEENGKETFGFEPSEHLDADAMNAYAENALPQLTRVRYAEHLISCDNCRHLVTQLALSSNPVITLEKKEAASVAAVTSSQTWREWFYSFLTLPKLKIAGPLAAVLCFAVITFVALQKNDLENSVTNQNQIESETALKNKTIDDRSDSVNLNAHSETPDNPDKNTNVSGKGEPTPVTKETASTKDGERDKAAKKETTPSASVEEKRAEPKQPEKNNSKEVETQPTPAVVAQTDATVATTATQSQNTVAQETQRQNAPQKGPSTPNRDRSQGNVALGGVTTNKPDAQPKDSDSKEAKKPAPVAAKKRTAASDDEDEKLAKSEVAANSRSVDGKQFTRKGNVWIDNAYKGTSTKNIKRGSDEYNSLDTGLRSVSEKLDGEVIIVWKGKAYKIY